MDFSEEQLNVYSRALKDFGSKLRKVRIAQFGKTGKAIEECATRMEVTPERWREFEAGKRIITFTDLFKMFGVLDADKFWLLDPDSAEEILWYEDPEPETRFISTARAEPQVVPDWSVDLTPADFEHYSANGYVHYRQDYSYLITTQKPIEPDHQGFIRQAFKERIKKEGEGALIGYVLEEDEPKTTIAFSGNFPGEYLIDIRCTCSADIRDLNISSCLGNFRFKPTNHESFVHEVDYAARKMALQLTNDTIADPWVVKTILLECDCEIVLVKMHVGVHSVENKSYCYYDEPDADKDSDSSVGGE